MYEKKRESRVFLGQPRTSFSSRRWSSLILFLLISTGDDLRPPSDGRRASLPCSNSYLHGVMVSLIAGHDPRWLTRKLIVFISYIFPFSYIYKGHRVLLVYAPFFFFLDIDIDIQGERERVREIDRWTDRLKYRLIDQP